MIGPLLRLAAAGVPKRAWLLAGLALLFAAGVLANRWHGAQIRALVARSTKAGAAEERGRWQADLVKVRVEALQWRQLAESRARTIAEQERTKINEDRRNLVADADRLRLHGPGAAAASCPGRITGSGLPAAANRPDGPGSGSGTGADPLPANDGEALAIVPWSWAVGTAERHDTLRSEVLGWRSWYERQKAAWDAQRGQLKAKALAPAE